MEQSQVVNTTGLGADDNQFLTFTLANEEYGIEILKVQEIKGHSAFTAIPNAPSYVKGVINLRGAVVPVVDLRARFAMECLPYDKFSVVIVVTVGAKVFGLVVDGVSDVLNIPHTEIEAAPDLGGAVDTSYLNGMARHADKFILLLDIEKVIGAGDVAPAVPTH
jgi:purine-binding chemotaxis protein CheW